MWPPCGHSLHLGCVAHMRVNQQRISCPMFRSGWPDAAQQQFARLCCQKSVAMPDASVFFLMTLHAYSVRSVGSMWNSCLGTPGWLMHGSFAFDEWTCLRCGACFTNKHPMYPDVASSTMLRGAWTSYAALVGFVARANIFAGPGAQFPFPLQSSCRSHHR